MRLPVRTPDERDLLLRAAEVLMLNMAEQPGGPTPQRLADAASVVSQLAQGAPVVRVALDITDDLRWAIGEVTRRSLARSR